MKERSQNVPLSIAVQLHVCRGYVHSKNEHVLNRVAKPKIIWQTVALKKALTVCMSKKNSDGPYVWKENLWQRNAAGSVCLKGLWPKTLNVFASPRHVAKTQTVSVSKACSSNDTSGHVFIPFRVRAHHLTTYEPC